MYLYAHATPRHVRCGMSGLDLSIRHVHVCDLPMSADLDKILCAYDPLNFIRRSASGTPERSCAKSESVIWRKDGSALRSVCLDGVVAAVSKSGDDMMLEFLEIADGDIFSVHNLTPNAARVVSLSVDGHRTAVIYENIKQRRLELKVVEFYTEHHAIGWTPPPYTDCTRTELCTNKHAYAHVHLHISAFIKDVPIRLEKSVHHQT